MKSKLYAKGNIGKAELRNRTIMTAMHSALSNKGEINDAVIEYYRIRAKGGAGLIVAGAAGIDPEHVNTHNMIQVYNDSVIPGLKKLTSAIQNEGAKIFIQLLHPGRYARSAEYSEAQAVAPSAISSRFTGETPRELTIEETEKIVTWYADAALRAKEAYFDGVEITAASGYLPAQFLSAVTNKREDKYGGDLQKRMTFILEVVAAVKEKTGHDFPLMIRVGAKDFISGGNDNADAVEICKKLEEAGVDAISVTGGWHETAVPQLTMGVPHAAFGYLCKTIKKRVTIPVVLSNRMNVESAEESIDNGICDFAGFARGFLADPFFPSKAEQGDYQLIRRCIGCNQACMDHIFYGQKIACLVNPEAGHEHELINDGLLPSEVQQAQSSKTMVVGAGIVGMDYSAWASLKGEKITIFEESEKRGGQAYTASLAGDRASTAEYTEYLFNICKTRGVNFHFNAKCTTDLVLKTFKDGGFDKLIIAAGRKALIPDIDTDESVQLTHAWDVLNKKIFPGKKVLIIGSNFNGVWTALHLAKVGTPGPEVLNFLVLTGAEDAESLRTHATDSLKKISIIEKGKKPGVGIGLSTRWSALMQLKSFGIKTELETTVENIQAGKVKLAHNGQTFEMEADTIIFTQTKGNNDIDVEQLKSKIDTIELLGDYNKTGNMFSAARKAYQLGMLNK